MKPSVGRIVHYVSYGTPGGEYKSECRAAVITEVPGHLPRSMEPLDGCPNGYEGVWVVGLCALNPTGMFFNRNVRQDEDGHEGGSWHWPEREPPDGGNLAGLDPEPLNLSSAQIKQLVSEIQAKLLQQAKRGRRTGLA